MPTKNLALNFFKGRILNHRDTDVREYGNQVICTRCGSVGSPEDASGDLYEYPCTRILDYPTATKLYMAAKKQRGGRAGFSVMVNPAFHLRLVQLQPDRYGLQWHRTYIARICDNGVFMITKPRVMDWDARIVFQLFLPVQLIEVDGKWWTQHGEPLTDPLIVDGRGYAM